MKFYFLSLILIFTVESNCLCQIKDTLYVHKNKAPKFYQTKVFKGVVPPVLLIGYSLTTMQNNGLPSSYWIYKQAKTNFKIQRTHVDDYFQFIPYFGLVALKLSKVKSKNDPVNTVLLVAKSFAVNNILLLTIKNLSNVTRPDSANPTELNSFPSGHTANVFTAATLIHKEFGKTHLLYSVGAYSVATSIGVFRILNNRHWFSDVIAGAGLGILSVNVVYLTHRYKWGKNSEIVFVPTMYQKVMGFYFAKQF